MFRSAVTYSTFALSLLFLSPAMWRMGGKIKRSPENAQAAPVHRYTSWWARLLARTCGARVHVTGLENIPKEGPVLFVAKHQSDFDIVVFLMTCPRPIGFVAKMELLKIPLLRTWMKHMRCVFMDRKDIRQSMKTILEAIDILKSGHSMVLFPEGTRSKAEEMLPFKAGAFKLATKTNAATVPVTISGSYKIIEENHYKITPADIYVTFHPPINVEALDAEQLAALPQTVEDRIREGLKG